MQNFIGKQINRYRIIERLGMGGMAVVYKAFDVSLNRDVAVKLIRAEAIPQEQHEKMLKRFLQEASALGRFSHPNIVPAYDYGEVDGIPYLVLAYLSGGTLKDRIHSRVSIQEALKTLMPIADAVAYAHEKGVLHRDIKPSNILFNDSGIPMLTDFGIAKVLETTDVTLTGTGLGVGTPEYMAPEQWQGQASEASDQYALGVVLYEMLTGEKPFTAETPLAIALKQLNEPLVKPSEIVPDIPAPLEKVLLQVLSREPDHRYQNVLTLKDAFEKIIQKYDGAEYSSTLNKGVRTRSDLSKKFTSRNVFSSKDKENDQENIQKNQVSRDYQENKINSDPIKAQKPASRKVQKKLIRVGVPLLLIGLLVLVLRGLIPSFLDKPENDPLDLLIGDDFESVLIQPTVLSNTASPLILDNNHEEERTSIVEEETIEFELSKLIPLNTANIQEVKRMTHMGRGAVLDFQLNKTGETLYVWADKMYAFDALSLEEDQDTTQDFPEAIKQISNTGIYAILKIEESYHLWDLQNDLSNQELDPKESVIYGNHWIFSPTDRYLLEATSKQIRLWDLGTNLPEIVWEYLIEGEVYSDFSLSDDGVALGAYIQHTNYEPESFKVIVHDFSLNTGVCTLQPGSYLSGARFSPDGTLLIVSENNRKRYAVYNLQTCGRNGAFNLPGDTRVQYFGDYSEDGELFATSGEDGTLFILSVDEGLKLINQHKVTNGSVENLIFSKSGESLYYLDGKGTISLVRVDNNEILAAIEPFDTWVFNYDISSDNSKVITLGGLSSDSSTIQLWDVGSGTKLFEKENLNGRLTDVTFSPDGNLIATSGEDGVIRLWLAEGLTQIAEFHGHRSPVFCVKFSPNGTKLASCGINLVLLWDISTGKVEHELQAFSYYIHNVAFSPDGELLAGIYNGYSLDIWRTDNGSKTLSKTGKFNHLYFLNNNSLLTIGGDLSPMSSSGEPNSLLFLDPFNGSIQEEIVLSESLGFDLNISVSVGEDILAFGGNLYSIESGDILMGLGEINLTFSSDGKLLLGGGNILSIYGVQSK